MKNYVEEGNTLSLAPSANVLSGMGYLFGAALFGVAVSDAISGQKSAFLIEGVVDIGKTSALAITAGDRMFWDATNKCVNKTTTAQQCIGIAIADAANPSATVRIRLGGTVPVAT